MPASAKDQLLLLYSHLDGWGEHAFAVGDALHQHVLHAIRGVELVTKWNLPFYLYKGYIGYINWGKQQQMLYLALYKGNLMNDAHGLLRADGNVTMIRKVFLPDVAAVQQPGLTSLLQQAADLNNRGVKVQLKPRKQPRS